MPSASVASAKRIGSTASSAATRARAAAATRARIRRSVTRTGSAPATPAIAGRTSPRRSAVSTFSAKTQNSA
jgi:hypothetical protein